jgi:flavin-dependent dehydrogenase
MNKVDFDCAIIGGGLAGLTLAIQLANAGRSVILFEKQKYPFHKVCGEYISMESFDFLERIGMPLSAMKLPMIDEVKISSPNGNSFTRKLDLGGFGISRYTLDTLLANLATNKGVTILQGTKVIDVVFENDSFIIKTTTATYTSKTACGAYGKRSSIEKKINSKLAESKAKTKSYVAVKYHVTLDLPSNCIELHNFKDGYCGVSKVDNGVYCLCYLTSSKNLNDNGNNIKKMEENVLMKNPFLKKHFTEATFLYPQPLTISQLSFHKKSAVENHVLLLGDSAGTIAPLCGNGMSMAMHASFKAFQLLENYFDNTSCSRANLETLYRNEWNTHFATRIKIGNTLQHLFGKEKLTNIAIATLKKMPSLTDKLISMTHGNTF